MDPVSTLALVAAFVIPPVPTRASDWSVKSIVRNVEPSSTTRLTHSLIRESGSGASTEIVPFGEGISTAPHLDRLQMLVAELSLYAELSDGWDGPESRGPSITDIADAQLLLSRFPSGVPIPRAMISSTGTVGLYWNSDQAFADIEFEGDGLFSLFTRAKAGDQQETLYDDIPVREATTEWLTEKLRLLV